MKDGLFPVVGVAGVVSVALVWGMSVHDPYWRLFDSPSVPAPAYEAPKDLRAALESATLSFGNVDTGASGPDIAATTGPEVAPMAALSDIDPLAETKRTGIAFSASIRETEAASIPGPMMAWAEQFVPALMTGPAAEGMADYESPRAVTLAPAVPESEEGSVLAIAPVPLAAPAALRDRDAFEIAEAAVAGAPEPFVAPEAPAQPRLAATEISEETLALDRGQRIDVQRRLALAGFDPKGFDGVFGPRTRGAITDFQTAWGFPATGYLEASVYADLNQRTEDAYQALRQQAAAAPSAAPELAPVARERQFASAEGSCARRSDGRIIARQSIACDLAGLTEKFISLGRNTLDHDETGEDVVTAQAPLLPGAARDR